MTSIRESSSKSAPATNVGSTPITQRARTAHYSCEPPPLQDKMKATLAEETKRRYVGPVDVSQFLEDCLPCSNSTPSVPSLSEQELNALREVADATSENNMYEPFKRALQRYAHGMIFTNTSSNSAKDSFPLKPDLCLYEAADTSQKTDFSAAELCIELKPYMSYDPFTDLDPNTNDDPFERDTVHANNTRGQITTYAVAQFNSQFRIFAFSIVVFNDHARLVRWDRAGAVVSTRFNYVQNSNLLTDFIWRFSHLSREERGHDRSVSPAKLSKQETQKVRQALGLKAGTPLFAFTVPHEDGDKVFYGPRFPFPVRSLVGRSTRTVPVCHFINGEPRKLFLKEYWRPEGMRGEIEIYQHLIRHNVEHIAPLVCGGDVPRGETRTHEHAKTRPISHRLLHRLVLDFVGRRLTEFKSTKELAQAVLHAMTAHWLAFDKAGILHRDVSVNNILINDDGQGVLIDWELAIFYEEYSAGRRNHDRTGTWQFISAALLRNHGEIHDLKDDIESFVHVLGWSFLRYAPFPLSGNSRKRMLVTLYDTSFPADGGGLSGNALKEMCLASGKYMVDADIKGTSPILELIRTIASPFQARYGEPPTASQTERYQRLKEKVAKGLCDQGDVEDHPAHTYQLGMERLKNSEWFLDTFKDALRRPDWPEKDAADAHLLPITEGTSKQQQLAAQRVETQSQLLSASSHPSGSLKRSASPPPSDVQHKRSRLDDNSDKTLE
ncbi:hypothetical protein BKA82DRAFT_25818 [Pisolithus tinctorius]|nr:hypothetical protein BKA82DRAFT_25818 [Pisolithus tinctorius]